MITYTQTTNDNARESEREGESGEEKTKKWKNRASISHAEKNPTILIGNEEILASFDANHGHL